jgi:hypothetical protein
VPERIEAGPPVLGHDRHEEPDRLTVPLDDQRFPRPIIDVAWSLNSLTPTDRTTFSSV